MKTNRSDRPNTNRHDSRIHVEFEELDHINNGIQQAELRLISSHFKDILQHLLTKGNPR